MKIADGNEATKQHLRGALPMQRQLQSYDGIGMLRRKVALMKPFSMQRTVRSMEQNCSGSVEAIIFHFPFISSVSFSVTQKSMAQPQQGVEQPQELEWNEKKGESRDNAQSNPHASDAQAGFAGSSASAVNPAVATQDRGTIGHMSVPASSAQKGAHSMPVVPPMMGVLMGPGAAAPPANAPPLTQSQRATMNSFWAQIAHDTASVHVRDQLHAINLPLARIKKIMKSDDDVRMISSEAPTLFAKACEIFILEVRRSLHLI